MQILPLVSTPSQLYRRHSSGSEAPPKGSTPVKLIVDSEVRGTTLQKLIMSEVSEVNE